MTVRVGILDSGIAERPGAGPLAGARAFAGGRSIRPPGSPRLRHGTEVARIVVGLAPQSRLLDARIFADRLSTDAANAAAGLRWLIEAGARLVNMSFGLRQDRAVLAEACRDAVSAGILLIASAPARGGPVFPAAYPGIITACGDARCAPGAISALGGVPADFGGCPRPWGAPIAAKIGGASFGAAHLTGTIAGFLARQPSAPRSEVLDYLETIAAFRGRERRCA